MELAYCFLLNTVLYICLRLFLFFYFFLTEITEFYLTGCSVQFSHSVMSDSLQPHESQHARPPCPSPTPGSHLNL